MNFCFKIEKICKYCKIEKLNNDAIIYMGSLIKINADEINKIDLYKILNDKLISRSRWPICGYNNKIYKDSPNR